MDNALENVSLSTHYMPDIWRGRGWEQHTKDEFSLMFQYKAKLFFIEILSVIFAPFVLMISLPSCADELCKFVYEVKLDIPGVGDICGFSSFDFDKFEDENWHGMGENKRPNDSYSEFKFNNRQSNFANNGFMECRKRPRARHGKIEKSFFHFKVLYSSWKCSASSRSLVHGFELFQRDQTRILLAKERELRIEAAKREIETLRSLEKNDGNFNQDFDPKVINESYACTVNENDQSKNDANKEMSVAVPDTNDNLVNTDEHGALSVCEAGVGDQFNHEMSASSIPEQHTSNILSSAQPSSPSVLTSSPSVLGSNLLATVSVLHYADTGLSAELRKLLDRSELEPGVSMLRSTFGKGTSFASLLAKSLHINDHLSVAVEGVEHDKDEALKIQHFLLDQYHSRMHEPLCNQNVIEEESTESNDSSVSFQSSLCQTDGGNLISESDSCLVNKVS